MACAGYAGYPERPVELILPFPGTGSTDIAGIPRISNRALSEEALQRSLFAQGMVAAPGTSDEFRAQVQNDLARWTKILRNAVVDR